MSEHRYFTVEPTALTIPKRGALAIYCGDAPREDEHDRTSVSLRAPLLVMPPEMFTGADETMAKVAGVLNAHAGEFFPSARAAAPVVTESEWQWWASRDAENYDVGPEPTRDAIIAEAVACEKGLDDDGDGPICSFYICEARQDPLRLADWIDADQLLVAAEDSLASSDRAGWEGDEGPWFEVTPEQERGLIERVKAACDAWQTEHGLVFTARTFSDSRNEEFLTVAVEAEGGAA